MNGTVQIGPVKYKKEEEATLARSLLSGTFLGLPLGLLLSYSLGFLENPGLPLDDSFGWTMFYFKVGSIVMVICWVVTFSVSLFLWKGRHKLSGGDLGRIIVASLLVPLIIIYTLLVTGLVFTPITVFLRRFLSPISTFAVSALLFFPFYILLVAIVGPDSKPGKTLRHSLNRLRKAYAQGT